MSDPSGEAQEARQQAEAARDEAVEYLEHEAAGKLADAVKAIARIRDHRRADAFLAMVQRALGEHER